MSQPLPTCDIEKQKLKTNDITHSLLIQDILESIICRHDVCEYVYSVKTQTTKFMRDQTNETDHMMHFISLNVYTYTECNNNWMKVITHNIYRFEEYAWLPE